MSYNDTIKKSNDDIINFFLTNNIIFKNKTMEIARKADFLNDADSQKICDTIEEFSRLLNILFEDK